MKKILLPLLLIPTLALGNPGSYTVGCKVQDSVGILDAGEGKAIVTYFNSGERCSNNFKVTLISQNGIAVEVIVTVGPDEETIVVVPLNDGLMAFPPQADVIDGDTVDIVVMGGVV